MKLVCGSDHAGLRLKEELKKHLEEKGITVHDVGTHSNESVDYPDFAVQVAHAVANHAADFGLLVCGTGFLFVPAALFRLIFGVIENDNAVSDAAGVHVDQYVEQLTDALALAVEHDAAKQAVRADDRRSPKPGALHFHFGEQVRCPGAVAFLSLPEHACLPCGRQTMPSAAGCRYRSATVSRVSAKRARCRTTAYVTISF